MEVRMETKTCSSCKQCKDVTEFGKNKQTKDGLKYICRVCERLSKKKHYDKNSEQYRARTAADKRKRAEKFAQWKQQCSCEVCHEDETVCLDFHHLDPTEKDFEVSAAMCDYSWERLMEEVKKCIVLCSNCHRKVHKYGLEQVKQMRA